MQKHEYSELGSFELTGDVIRVSDPLYDRDVWCCGTIPDCVPGQWDAAVVYSDEGEFGNRVAMLCAKASEVESFADCDRINIGGDRYRWSNPWAICDIDVGVDSGQCGIFDEAHYQDNSDFSGMPEAVHNYGDAFCNYCCDATLGEKQAGVLPHGAVSSSGYGDGSYRAFTMKNENGKVCAVAIVYL